MLLGREVQFAAVFLSCTAVLWNRTGAFGTEEATGSPACDSRCVCPISCSPSPAVAERHGGFHRCHGGLIRRLRAGMPESPALAMALPDGPGAVCIGVVGFVCVSLVKNRRIWIGLCLFAISHGRIAAARLAKMSAPAPDCAGSDSLSENGSSHLWRWEPSCRGRRPPRVRPVTSLRVPHVLIAVPAVWPAPHRWCRDDRGSTFVPPDSDVTRERSPATRPILARGTVMDPSVCGKSVQLARPPPVLAQIPLG